MPVCVCLCDFLPPPSSSFILQANKSTSCRRPVQWALAHLPFSLLPSWVAHVLMYLGLWCRFVSWSQRVWPWEMVQGILQENKGMTLSWLLKMQMSGGPALRWCQVWGTSPRDWGLWIFEGKFCILGGVSATSFPCMYQLQAGSGGTDWSVPHAASPTQDTSGLGRPNALLGILPHLNYPLLCQHPPLTTIKS